MCLIVYATILGLDAVQERIEEWNEPYINTVNEYRKV